MTPNTDEISGRWLIYSSPIVLVLLMLLSVVMFRRAEVANGQLWETERVRVLTLRALSSLQDAETGQRGYLLSGDESHLEEYATGRDSVRGQLALLKRLTADQPRQQEYLRILTPVVDDRVRRLDSAITARREGDLKKAVAIVSEGRGKLLMDSARKMFSLMRREEIVLLAQSQERDLRDRRRLQFAILLGAMLTALVSFYTSTKLANDATRQWLLSAELRARIDMLRGQVPKRTPREEELPFERPTPTSSRTTT